MREVLRGTGVAMVTPFNDDLSIDFDALRKLVQHLIEGGIDYLVALGTTGETATLSDKERFQVLDCIVAANSGRLPIVAGFGGNDTNHIIQSIKQYGTSQFSAILSVSPYYNRPTQEGIYEHYKAVAYSTELPLILYNVPARTGSNITAETTLKLAEDFENIVGVKEASGNITQCTEILKHRPEDFAVISGDDFLTLPFISLGMDGVISVIGNALPSLFSSLVNRALSGQFEEARKGHFELLDMMHLIFEEGNPAGVKEAMRQLGVGSNTVRLPLVPASSNLRTKIAAALEQLNVKTGAI